MNIDELKARADKNDIQAIIDLGDKYFAGDGVEKDFAQAAVWYKKAADLGFGPACRQIGLMLLHGVGVSADNEASIKYFMKGAELNDYICLYTLGMMCKDGNVLPPNSQEAVSWLEKSAAQGYIPAHYELGKIYLYGFEGIAVDEDKAKEHLTIVAEHNGELSVPAMNHLGNMYQAKQSVENFEIAFSWFDKAADKDDFYGAHLARLMSSILASSGAIAAAHMGSWDLALADYETEKRCLDREERLIKSGRFEVEEKIKKEIPELKVANNYERGTCLFFLKRYQDVCSVLGKNGSLSSRLLYVAAVLVGNLTSEKKNLYQVINDLETNVTYNPCEDKGYAAENAYGICMLYIADLHRNLGGKELEISVKLLDRAIEMVKDEAIKNVLKQERSHYQTRFLGGYKYV